MERNAKYEWREDIVNSLNKSGAIFVANYTGMTVEELTTFRRDLRSVQAEFSIVKNKVAQKALEGRDEAPIAKFFKNQTGVVFAYGDSGAAAKSVSEAAKKFEKLKLVGGFMDKATLSVSDIESLASLPSREVLVGKILGSMVAPHRRMLGVLNGVTRNLVQVLNAIKEKKEV